MLTSIGSAMDAVISTTCDKAIRLRSVRCHHYNKKSPANANGNAQQWCMFESLVKRSLSQSPKGAKRPAAH